MPGAHMQSHCHRDVHHNTGCTAIFGAASSGYHSSQGGSAEPTLRREERSVAEALLHQRERRKAVVHMRKVRPAEVHQVHLRRAFFLLQCDICRTLDFSLWLVAVLVALCFLTGPPPSLEKQCTNRFLQG